MTIQEIARAEAMKVLESLYEQIPANPIAEPNARLADRLEAELRRYFCNLELAFPYDQLEQAYLQAITDKES